MTELPLAGFSVLVTRPRPQADSLARSLGVLGATAFVFPVLSIQPLSLSAEALDRIASLDQYAGVVCISVPAATLGVELCADRWPQWPVRQTWYAVGPASGRALEGRGLDLVTAPAGSTSETLLDIPALQSVEGQRFLILRGEGGRETLATHLRLRGAQVDYLELYRREQAIPERAILHDFLAARARVVTATSGESVDQLLALAGDAAEALKDLPLVVVSGRLAQHAHAKGFTQVVVATGASDHALAEAIRTVSSSVGQPPGCS
jgi:uroporphyrinogen-III synthase